MKKKKAYGSLLLSTGIGLMVVTGCSRDRSEGEHLLSTGRDTVIFTQAGGYFYGDPTGQGSDMFYLYMSTPDVDESDMKIRGNGTALVMELYSPVAGEKIPAAGNYNMDLSEKHIPYTIHAGSTMPLGASYLYKSNSDRDDIKPLTSGRLSIRNSASGYELIADLSAIETDPVYKYTGIPRFEDISSQFTRYPEYEKLPVSKGYYTGELMDKGVDNYWYFFTDDGVTGDYPDYGGNGTALIVDFYGNNTGRRLAPPGKYIIDEQGVINGNEAIPYSIIPGARVWGTLFTGSYIMVLDRGNISENVIRQMSMIISETKGIYTLLFDFTDENGKTYKFKHIGNLSAIIDITGTDTYGIVPVKPDFQ